MGSYAELHQQGQPAGVVPADARHGYAGLYLQQQAESAARRTSSAELRRSSGVPLQSEVYEGPGGSPREDRSPPRPRAGTSPLRSQQRSYAALAAAAVDAASAQATEDTGGSVRSSPPPASPPKPRLDPRVSRPATTVLAQATAMRTARLKRLAQRQQAIQQPPTATARPAGSRKAGPRPVRLSAVLQQTPSLYDRQRLSAVERFIEEIDPLPPRYTDAQVVYLSKNSLTGVSGLEQLQQLRVLGLADNLLADPHCLEELAAACPALEALSLEGNPLASVPHYRARVLQALPGLKALDGRPVGEEERAAAPAALATEDAVMAVLLRNACEVHKMASVVQRSQLHMELLHSLHCRGAPLRRVEALADAAAGAAGGGRSLARLVEMWDYEGGMGPEERRKIHAALLREVGRMHRDMRLAPGAKPEPAWEEAFTQVMIAQQRTTAALLDLMTQCQAASDELLGNMASTDPSELGGGPGSESGSGLVAGGSGGQGGLAAGRARLLRDAEEDAERHRELRREREEALAELREAALQRDRWEQASSGRSSGPQRRPSLKSALRRSANAPPRHFSVDGEGSDDGGSSAPMPRHVSPSPPRWRSPRASPQMSAEAVERLMRARRSAAPTPQPRSDTPGDASSLGGRPASTERAWPGQQRPASASATAEGRGRLVGAEPAPSGRSGGGQAAGQGSSSRRWASVDPSSLGRGGGRGRGATGASGAAASGRRFPRSASSSPDKGPRSPTPPLQQPAWRPAGPAPVFGSRSAPSSPDYKDAAQAVARSARALLAKTQAEAGTSPERAQQRAAASAAVLTAAAASAAAATAFPSGTEARAGAARPGPPRSSASGSTPAEEEPSSLSFAKDAAGPYGEAPDRGLTSSPVLLGRRHVFNPSEGWAPVAASAGGRVTHGTSASGRSANTRRSDQGLGPGPGPSSGGGGSAAGSRAGVASVRRSMPGLSAPPGRLNPAFAATRIDDLKRQVEESARETARLRHIAETAARPSASASMELPGSTRAAAGLPMWPQHLAPPYIAALPYGSPSSYLDLRASAPAAAWVAGGQGASQVLLPITAPGAPSGPPLDPGSSVPWGLAPPPEPGATWQHPHPQSLAYAGARPPAMPSSEAQGVAAEGQWLPAQAWGAMPPGSPVSSPQPQPQLLPASLQPHRGPWQGERSARSSDLGFHNPAGSTFAPPSVSGTLQTQHPMQQLGPGSAPGSVYGGGFDASLSTPHVAAAQPAAFTSEAQPSAPYPPPPQLAELHPQMQPQPGSHYSASQQARSTMEEEPSFGSQPHASEHSRGMPRLRLQPPPPLPQPSAPPGSVFGASQRLAPTPQELSQSNLALLQQQHQQQQQLGGAAEQQHAPHYASGPQSMASAYAPSAGAPPAPASGAGSLRGPSPPPSEAAGAWAQAAASEAGTAFSGPPVPHSMRPPPTASGHLPGPPPPSQPGSLHADSLGPRGRASALPSPPQSGFSTPRGYSGAGADAPLTDPQHAQSLGDFSVARASVDVLPPGSVNPSVLGSPSHVSMGSRAPSLAISPPRYNPDWAGAPTPAATGPASAPRAPVQRQQRPQQPPQQQQQVMPQHTQQPGYQQQYDPSQQAQHDPWTGAMATPAAPLSGQQYTVLTAGPAPAPTPGPTALAPPYTAVRQARASTAAATPGGTIISVVDEASGAVATRVEVAEVIEEDSAGFKDQHIHLHIHQGASSAMQAPDTGTTDASTPQLFLNAGGDRTRPTPAPVPYPTLTTMAPTPAPSPGGGDTSAVAALSTLAPPGSPLHEGLATGRIVYEKIERIRPSGSPSGGGISDAGSRGWGRRHSSDEDPRAGEGRRSGRRRGSAGAGGPGGTPGRPNRRRDEQPGFGYDDGHAGTRMRGDGRGAWDAGGGGGGGSDDDDEGRDDTGRGGGGRRGDGGRGGREWEADGARGTDQGGAGRRTPPRPPAPPRSDVREQTAAEDEVQQRLQEVAAEGEDLAAQLQRLQSKAAQEAERRRDQAQSQRQQATGHGTSKRGSGDGASSAAAVASKAPSVAGSTRGAPAGDAKAGLGADLAAKDQRNADLRDQIARLTEQLAAGSAAEDEGTREGSGGPGGGGGGGPGGGGGGGPPGGGGGGPGGPGSGGGGSARADAAARSAEAAAAALVDLTGQANPLRAMEQQLLALTLEKEALERSLMQEQAEVRLLQQELGMMGQVADALEDTQAQLQETRLAVAHLQQELSEREQELAAARERAAQREVELEARVAAEQERAAKEAADAASLLEHRLAETRAAAEAELRRQAEAAEAAAARAAAAADATLAAAASRHAAALAAVEAERAASEAALMSGHRAELEELRGSCAEELRAFAEESAADLAAAEQRIAAALAAHEEEAAALRAEMEAAAKAHKAAVEQLEARHKQQLEDLTEEQQAQIDHHVRQLDEKMAEHRDELEELAERSQRDLDAVRADAAEALSKAKAAAAETLEATRAEAAEALSRCLEDGIAALESVRAEAAAAAEAAEARHGEELAAAVARQAAAEAAAEARLAAERESAAAAARAAEEAARQAEEARVALEAQLQEALAALGRERMEHGDLTARHMELEAAEERTRRALHALTDWLETERQREAAADLLARRSLLRRALCHWAINAIDSRTHSHQAAVAAAHHRRRECRRVLRRWHLAVLRTRVLRSMLAARHADLRRRSLASFKANVLSRRRKARAASIAAAHCALRLQARCFVAWRRLVRAHARAAAHWDEDASLAAVTHHSRVLTGAVLAAWHEHVHLVRLPKTQRRRRAARAYQRRLLRRGLAGFAAHVARRDVKRAQLARSERRFRFSLLSRALSAWTDVMERARRKRCLRSAAALQWGHTVVARWRTAARRSRAIRRGMEAMQASLGTRRLREALARWRSAVLLRRQRAVAERLADEHRRGALLWRCLAAWLAQAQAAAQRQLHVRGMQEYQRMMQAALRWQRLVDLSRRQAAVVDRAVRLYRHRVLQGTQRAVLRHWRAAVEQRRALHRSAAIGFVHAFLAVRRRRLLVAWHGLAQRASQERWHAANAELRSQVERGEASLRHAYARLDAAGAEHDAMLEQLRQVQADVLELRQQAEAEELRLAHTDAALAEARLALEARGAELTARADEVQALTAERELLQQRVDALRQQVAAGEVSAASLQEQAGALQRVLAAAQAQVRDLGVKLQQQATQSEEQLVAARDEASLARREAASLAAAVSRSEAALAEGEAQLRGVRAAHEQLVAELRQDLRAKEAALMALGSQPQQPPSQQQRPGGDGGCCRGNGGGGNAGAPLRPGPGVPGRPPSPRPGGAGPTAAGRPGGPSAGDRLRPVGSLLEQQMQQQRAWAGAGGGAGAWRDGQGSCLWPPEPEESEVGGSGGGDSPPPPPPCPRREPLFEPAVLAAAAAAATPFAPPLPAPTSLRRPPSPVPMRPVLSASLPLPNPALFGLRQPTGGLVRTSLRTQPLLLGGQALPSHAMSPPPRTPSTDITTITSTTSTDNFDMWVRSPPSPGHGTPTTAAAPAFPAAGLARSPEDRGPLPPPLPTLEPSLNWPRPRHAGPVHTATSASLQHPHPQPQAAASIGPASSQPPRAPQPLQAGEPLWEVPSGRSAGSAWAGPASSRPRRASDSDPSLAAAYASASGPGPTELLRRASEDEFQRRRAAILATAAAAEAAAAAYGTAASELEEEDAVGARGATSVPTVTEVASGDEALASAPRPSAVPLVDLPPSEDEAPPPPQAQPQQARPGPGSGLGSGSGAAGSRAHARTLSDDIDRSLKEAAERMSQLSQQQQRQQQGPGQAQAQAPVSWADGPETGGGGSTSGTEASALPALTAGIVGTLTSLREALRAPHAQPYSAVPDAPASAAASAPAGGFGSGPGPDPSTARDGPQQSAHSTLTLRPGRYDALTTSFGADTPDSSAGPQGGESAVEVTLRDMLRQSAPAPGPTAASAAASSAMGVGVAAATGLPSARPPRLPTAMAGSSGIGMGGGGGVAAPTGLPRSASAGDPRRTWPPPEGAARGAPASNSLPGGAGAGAGRVGASTAQLRASAGAAEALAAAAAGMAARLPPDPRDVFPEAGHSAYTHAGAQLASSAEERGL